MGFLGAMGDRALPEIFKRLNLKPQPLDLESHFFLEAVF